MAEQLTYEQWCAEVAFQFDMRFAEELGDYPPAPLRDWFDEGLDPDQAATRAYRFAMGE